MAQRSCVVVLAFLAVIAAGGAAETEPTVQVTGGSLRGRVLGVPGGAVFKGIPFAQPPVGELRWHEPMPAVPWTGVRDGGEFGHTCAQLAAGPWNQATADQSSEDCLYLNVWTPEWPARSRLPVMVWFHGGSNTGGAGSEPIFNGEKLAHRGVVLVTINYRLGALGFLAHPALTAASAHHSSGNYGLLDQIAALGWVRDNIAKFGGDPANVTLFGQSAGAQDIGLLMTSPLAKGLFRNAIGQSGSVVIGGRPLLSLAQAEQAGQAFAEKLGAADLKAMRARTAADVLQAQKAVPRSPGPAVDGWVVAAAPQDVFRKGLEHKVPLLIGNNSRESGFQGGPEALRKAIEETYGNLAPAALKLYGLAGEPPASTYPPYGEAGAQWSTDVTFRCPAVVTADWHSAAGSPVFEYEFSHAIPGTPAASHSGELWHLWGNFSTHASFSYGVPPLDDKISDLLQQYWTNFAKTGNPNGPGIPAWPKYSAGTREYIEIGDEGPVVKSQLRRPFCEVFAERLKLY